MDREKSIANDLRKYLTDELLIEKADEIYRSKNSRISRQKKRILLLFYYTLEAYRILYGPVDPNKLGKLFSLKQGQQNTAYSSFSNRRENHVYFTSPINLISDYCDELRIDKYKEEIVDFARDMLERDKSLYNKYPQTVAGGILLYYFSNIGSDMSQDKISEVVGKTPATLKKMAVIIQKIDNT